MNNFNKNMNQNNPFINIQKMKPKKTNGAIKFTFAVLLGIVPLLLCALFVTSSGNQEFNQWGATTGLEKIKIDYGLMWLLGIGIYIISLVITIIMIKIIKNIYLDIVPLVSSSGLVLLNMFVIPHSDSLFLILSVPSFLIIGYIIGIIIVIISSMNSIRKEIIKTQENGHNPLHDLQKQSNKPINKEKNNEYKDNPFIDVDSKNEK
ncbi:MAG: hypothetical protein HRS50_00365 [Mycoplasmataceae bacterium]|nr:hypothetical protein [Mycoplasmataceae bacterium]